MINCPGREGKRMQRSATVKKGCDLLYSGICRTILGDAPAEFPPLYLYAIWLVIILLRLHPATLSLWEDEIFDLVVKVNATWRVALGFENTNITNHILYAALSKIIIKALHHHWVEFVYRIPSLVAGALILPIAFMVFARTAGRFCAVTGTLLLCLLPQMTYHVSSARSYMLWMLLTVICWGLSPGVAGVKRWGRLAGAYFLLGLAHPFGLIVLACFGVLGCFTGNNRCTLRDWFVNASLSLPAFVYCVPIMSGINKWGGTAFTGYSSWKPSSTMAFLPDYFKYFFGSSIFPGYEYLWIAIVLLGLLAIWKKSPRTAVVYFLFMLAVPAVFVLKNQPGNFGRYGMGAFPFWLAAASAGLQQIREKAMNLAGPKKGTLRERFFNASVIAAAVMLVIPWLPDLARNSMYPKHDYRSLYKTYTADFPGSVKLFSTFGEYACGFDYYGRQYGVDYQVVPSQEAVLDSLGTGNGCSGLVYNSEINPLVLYPWIEKNGLVLYGVWKGSESPRLYLFMPKACVRN
jgi:hypothetical protein